MEILGVTQEYTYPALGGGPRGSIDVEFARYLEQVAESQRTDGARSLEQKYGEIIYHVGDASRFLNWERNDFPVEQLFLENGDIEALYRWEPRDKRTNPSGFEKHIQDRLKTIKDGSRSVMIHPDIQRKMQQDPQYARSVYDMIDRYFQKDIMINERIVPGSTLGIIQFVSIGSDGKIDQTCTITNSVSQSGRDDTLPGNTRETYKIRAGMDSQIMKTYGQDDGTREGYSADTKGLGVLETCWEAEYLYGEYLKRRAV